MDHDGRMAIRDTMFLAAPANCTRWITMVEWRVIQNMTCKIRVHISHEMHSLLGQIASGHVLSRSKRITL